MSRGAERRGRAVFDASPLIFLSRLGLLKDALDLFSESVVAKTVMVEIVETGRTLGSPEIVGIESLLEADRISVRPAPQTPLRKRLESNPRLSNADRDTIALAAERDARVLADDAAVRNVARQLGIPLGGTLCVIFGLVDERRVEPERGLDYLDQLIDAGWYCSAQLYGAARKGLESRRTA